MKEVERVGKFIYNREFCNGSEVKEMVSTCNKVRLVTFCNFRFWEVKIYVNMFIIYTQFV
jgi:hypothetical protein